MEVHDRALDVIHGVHCLLGDEVLEDRVVQAVLPLASGEEKVHVEGSELLLGDLTEALDVEGGVSKGVLADKLLIVRKELKQHSVELVANLPNGLHREHGTSHNERVSFPIRLYFEWRLTGAS